VTTGGGERARRRLAAGAGMAGRRAGCERGQEAACRRRLGHGREEDETQQRDGSKRAPPWGRRTKGERKSCRRRRQENHRKGLRVRSSGREEKRRGESG